jgi:hypothetical protein
MRHADSPAQASAKLGIWPDSTALFGPSKGGRSNRTLGLSTRVRSAGCRSRTLLYGSMRMALSVVFGVHRVSRVAIWLVLSWQQIEGGLAQS